LEHELREEVQRGEDALLHEIRLRAEELVRAVWEARGLRSRSVEHAEDSRVDAVRERRGGSFVNPSDSWRRPRPSLVPWRRSWASLLQSVGPEHLLTQAKDGIERPISPPRALSGPQPRWRAEEWTRWLQEALREEAKHTRENHQKGREEALPRGSERVLQLRLSAGIGSRISCGERRRRKWERLLRKQARVAGGAYRHPRGVAGWEGINI